MMTTVGVKGLKDKLTNSLRRASRGERVDRGRPLALLSPAEESSELRLANRLVATGVASRGGGKPVGSNRPPRSHGETVAEAVLEDRR
jgi:antitoxin (DNA-binding transcriptional repressor) of toxin-antitoxin stability system